MYARESIRTKIQLTRFPAYLLGTISPSKSCTGACGRLQTLSQDEAAAIQLRRLQRAKCVPWGRCPAEGPQRGRHPQKAGGGAVIGRQEALHQVLPHHSPTAWQASSGRS